MKSPESWHQSQLCVNAENYVDEMQTFIRAIQEDAYICGYLDAERGDDPVVEIPEGS